MSNKDRKTSVIDSRDGRNVPYCLDIDFGGNGETHSHGAGDFILTSIIAAIESGRESKFVILALRSCDQQTALHVELSSTELRDMAANFVEKANELDKKVGLH